jgi:2-iminobutanoate/2-iminopropanoate deaminase
LTIRYITFKIYLIPPIGVVKMKKQVVSTTKAAAPKAPYSLGIVYNDLLFVSGAGPIDPSSQEFVRGTIQEEARVTLNNVKAVIEDAGFSMENVLKVTVFLADFNDFDQFNEVYKEFFQTDFPARTCTQAGKLGYDIKCEVEAIVGR